jgi:hypothetical protein
MVEVKDIDLPEAQRSCMRCANFNEFGNCSEGQKVDQSDMTIFDNKCKKFKTLISLEW